MPTLTVIIPAYNERQSILDTVKALMDQLVGSDFGDPQVVVVDDGSTDGTAGALAALRLPHLKVVSQPNQGRLGARRTGLGIATGDYVLFLDSRIRLIPGSLQFLADRVAAGQHVWNGHVYIETSGNPYGHFWNVLTELAFSAYFARPRTTSFGAADFDAFPKGTGCFLAPTSLLREAFAAFRTRYVNERYASDDTPIIRWLAARTPINISPSFACWYLPRGSLVSFWRHALHRGMTFLDGHGRPESRFFPAVLLFYPSSILVAATALKRPRLMLSLAAAGSVAMGLLATAKRRRPVEVLSFAALAPIYALAHGAGMWRGLGMLLVSQTLKRSEEEG